MKTDANASGAPRKAWNAPVLNQLTVDLGAIATNGRGAGDGPGTGNASHKS